MTGAGAFARRPSCSPPGGQWIATPFFVHDHSGFPEIRLSMLTLAPRSERHPGLSDTVPAIVPARAGAEPCLRARFEPLERMLGAGDSPNAFMWDEVRGWIGGSKVGGLTRRIPV